MVAPKLTMAMEDFAVCAELPSRAAGTLPTGAAAAAAAAPARRSPSRWEPILSAALNSARRALKASLSRQHVTASSSSIAMSTASRERFSSKPIATSMPTRANCSSVSLDVSSFLFFDVGMCRRSGRVSGDVMHSADGVAGGPNARVDGAPSRRIGAVTSQALINQIANRVTRRSARSFGFAPARSPRGLATGDFGHDFRVPTLPTHARYAAANKARPAAHPDNGSHHRKPCARGAAGPLSCGVPCSCSAAWRSCTGQSHPGGAQKNSSHATGSAVGLSAVSL